MYKGLNYARSIPQGQIYRLHLQPALPKHAYGMRYGWGGYGGVGGEDVGLPSTFPFRILILHQSLQLQAEYPGDQIRAINGLFARQKVLLDLLPIWVAGERDKEVWTAKLGGKSNGVLVQLFHEAWASLEGRGEDNALFASLIACSSSSSMGVDDCLIFISPNGLLIGFEPMEVIALDGNVYIAHKVLKQSTAMEEAVELAQANLQCVGGQQ